MAGPFLDYGLVHTALEPLIPQYVREIVNLSGQVEAGALRRLTQTPGLVLMPQGSEVQGDLGRGNGRRHTELIGITIQLYDAAPLDRWPRPSLSAIRAAIWELLEAVQLDPNWAPLRYAGGEREMLDDGLWTWTERYVTETSTPRNFL